MTESLLDKVITGAFICKDEIEYRLDTLKSKLDQQERAREAQRQQARDEAWAMWNAFKQEHENLTKDMEQFLTDDYHLNCIYCGMISPRSAEEGAKTARYLQQMKDTQDQMHALLESQQETMKALVAYLKEQHGFMLREEHERYMED